MTHFLLHGGATRRTDLEGNKKFFQNICKDGDKILIIPFASQKDTWENGYEIFSERCTFYNPNKKLSFTLASESSLRQQIHDHDVLLLTGGGLTKQLDDVMNQINYLSDLLQGKVIAGISSGAAIRVYAYYSARNENIGQGNCFLPIKLMVHRGADRRPGLSKEERLDLLEHYGEQFPVYKIPEGEYIEFKL